MQSLVSLGAPWAGSLQGLVQGTHHWRLVAPPSPAQRSSPAHRHQAATRRYGEYGEYGEYGALLCGEHGEYGANKTVTTSFMITIAKRRLICANATCVLFGKFHVLNYQYSHDITESIIRKSEVR